MESWLAGNAEHQTMGENGLNNDQRRSRTKSVVSDSQQLYQNWAQESTQLKPIYQQNNQMDLTIKAYLDFNPYMQVFMSPNILRDNSLCGVREMNLNHENEKSIEEYSSLQKGQTEPELTGVEHDDTENWEEYGKIGGSRDSDANQTQDEDGKHNKMKLIKKMQINPEIML